MWYTGSHWHVHLCCYFELKKSKIKITRSHKVQTNGWAWRIIGKLWRGSYIVYTFGAVYVFVIIAAIRRLDNYSQVCVCV